MAKTRKSDRVVTNRDLAALLTSLGFQSSETMSEFHRAWHHPEAGTLILLPAKKDDQPALVADLHSARTHLDYNGHLEARDFDEFVKTGKTAVS